jgi:hypothetical protein
MNPVMQGRNATVLSEPAQVDSLKDSKRCQYRYANGKRCRLPGSKLHFGFCSHHFSLSSSGASQHSYGDWEDLSSALLPELSESHSAININRFLARLLALVTKGRISPRRAAVLSYIANQLIHSPRHRP